MTNYICINGKKAELTEEQMKALGIELPNANPFERVVNHTTNDFYSYYFITSMGTVNEAVDHGFENGNGNDELRYRAGNYCTDEELLKQRALHEILNRLLWRYSMEHDGEGHVTICYDIDEKMFRTQTTCFKYFEPSFATFEIAQNAIEEIIKPFMKAHPEFKW